MLAAGVAGVAAVTVAGCSSYGNEPESPATASAAGSAGSAGSDGSARSGGSLAKVADVPVGGGLILADRKVVLTQPESGMIKGFSAICTHQGCTVNAVQDAKIDCPCHGSQYNVADGSVAKGPATKGLAPVNVSVKGEDIVLA